METFVHNIGQVLGTTILHSLWQGLLIYAIIRLGFIAFPAARAGKKYKALYVALSAMAVWFGYTFFIEAKAYNWSAQPPQSFAMPVAADIQNTSLSQLNQAVEQPFYYRYKPLLQTYLPYITAIYLLSVFINVVRLAIGWQKIRSIKKQAVVATQWQALTSKLSAQAGIVKNVQIYFSKVFDVPCAVGYLKPILLLPFTIGTQLSAEEIEVIILHELAHIKNNDYILNLIQQIMTLSLFLNPFARLISNMIDLERENRCDDTVIQTGNTLIYAGALVKLEKTRQQNLQLAMAATGKKYHLFDRVKRIMSDDKPVVNIKHLVFGLLIFISALGSIAWLNPEIENGKLVSKNGAAAVNRLAELVKEVITPVKREEEPKISAERNIPVVDSITRVVQVDSAALKKAERELLIDEYEKVFIDWVNGDKLMKKMLEGKELESARNALDSVRKIKFRAVLTPELEQEIKNMNNISAKYRTNPEVLKREALQRQWVARYLSAVNKQPEVVAFDNEHKRQRDSVQNAIMQANNITLDELQKNEEWEDWLMRSSSQRSRVVRKLEYLPEIKALQDSLNKMTQLITTAPEYEEYKSRKWSQAYIDAFNSPGLEKYEAAVREAKDKMNKTAVAIKYQQDQKRLDEISKRMRQLKQEKP